MSSAGLNKSQTSGVYLCVHCNSRYECSNKAGLCPKEGCGQTLRWHCSYCKSTVRWNWRSRHKCLNNEKNNVKVQRTIDKNASGGRGVAEAAFKEACRQEAQYVASTAPMGMAGLPWCPPQYMVPPGMVPPHAPPGGSTVSQGMVYVPYGAVPNSPYMFTQPMPAGVSYPSGLGAQNQPVAPKYVAPPPPPYAVRPEPTAPAGSGPASAVALGGDVASKQVKKPERMRQWKATPDPAEPSTIPAPAAAVTGGQANALERPAPSADGLESLLAAAQEAEEETKKNKQKTEHPVPGPSSPPATTQGEVTPSNGGAKGGADASTTPSSMKARNENATPLDAPAACDAAAAVPSQGDPEFSSPKRARPTLSTQEIRTPDRPQASPPAAPSSLADHSAAQEAETSRRQARKSPARRSPSQSRPEPAGRLTPPGPPPSFSHRAPPADGVTVNEEEEKDAASAEAVVQISAQMQAPIDTQSAQGSRRSTAAPFQDAMSRPLEGAVVSDDSGQAFSDTVNKPPLSQAASVRNNARRSRTFSATTTQSINAMTTTRG